MKKNILFYLALIPLMLLSSCKKEDPLTIALELPTADFNFTVGEDGYKVVFTDMSQNARSYFWDFGDGSTSTDQNPTHTYSDTAIYNIVFTITGEKNKTSTKKKELKLGEGTKADDRNFIITLDGKFEDWDLVPPSRMAITLWDEATSSENAFRLKEIRFCANKDYLYMYTKMDTLFANAMDLYLNVDGNKVNGYNGWMWKDLNADYMLQGFMADKYDMAFRRYDESKGGSWGWIELASEESGLYEMSKMTKIEGNIVVFEARIPLATLRGFITGDNPEIGATLKIAVGHSGKESGAWDTSGGLPTVTASGDKNIALEVKID